MRTQRSVRGLCAAIGTLLLGLLIGDGAPAQGGATRFDPPPHARMGVYLRGASRLVPGTRAALRVAAHWTASATVTHPLAGAHVDVLLDGSPVWSGETDHEGDAAAGFLVPVLAVGKHVLTVDAKSPLGQEHHTQSVEIAPSRRARLESDKPIYQPGQTIHLRLVALGALDLAPVAGEAVTIDIEDPRGNRLRHLESKTSRFGIASIDLPLADEILLGAYHAKARLADGTAADLALPVERYRPPSFKLDVTPDRAAGAPGDHVKLIVDARYFFGKPVTGELTIRAALDGNRAAFTLHARTDDKGHASVETQIPATAIDGESLSFAVELRDGAGHLERTARALAIASQSLRFDAIAESGSLIGALDNRVWVVALAADGKPAAGVRLEGTLGERAVSATTDAAGIAVIHAANIHDATGACHAGWSALHLAASDGAGGRATFDRCLPHDATGRILVRADHALYPSGAPIAVEVRAASDGPAFVDLTQEGQIVATSTIDIRDGIGHATIAGDPARQGTLSLRAYRIDGDGHQHHDARLLYMAPRDQLTVDARPEQASYQPGSQGRIHLHVANAQGEGVAAALGVVMVDEAVLALRSVPSRSEALFFLLAREATRPTLRHAPGGYSVENVVASGRRDALADEATQALLAGAAPPWSGTWQSDPWTERTRRWQTQKELIETVVTGWSRFHDVGNLVDNTWRWRPDLVRALVDAGQLTADSARDPWGKPIGPVRLAELALDGKQLARDNATTRLETIYQALSSAAAQGSLHSEREKKSRVYRITLEDLARIDGIPRGALTDPWGQPWHIRTIAQPRSIAGVLARDVVTSLGPDGKPDTADDIQLPFEQRWGRGYGYASGSAFGMGGLGVIGMGAGGGGTGEGFGGLGGRSTVSGSFHHSIAGGKESGGGGEARVREDFPETLLWLPEVLTDEHGDAVIDVALADSITTWMLDAQALDAAGHLGQGSARVRVFQDFFVDIDAPPAVTQHDEIALPVAVYNYLPSAARIGLELAEAEGFTFVNGVDVTDAGRTQSITLAPGEVGVRYFRVRADKPGRHAVMVRARAEGNGHFADAVRRTIEVFPDGEEKSVSFSDMVGEDASPAHHFVIPDNALADASIGQLKVYPSMATHVVEGLDGMLRMPGGCFEQTSSSNYPNALILDYLQKTKQAKPEAVKKAHQLLDLGWQRLLSFEVPGGGFSWFGQAPANQILTAYGLQEFRDMARVHPIDERVIERTQRWLASRQHSDGSWAPDTQFINEGATNRFNHDVTRITAYIGLSLRRSGDPSTAAKRAADYVRAHLDGEKDPYTLALAASLLSGDGKDATAAGAELDAVMTRLWSTHTDDTKGARFDQADKTLTWGSGQSGSVETTAMATSAMLAARAPQERVDGAVKFLLASKDRNGAWMSTQATILSLKALLEWQAHATRPGKGVIHVELDGHEIARTVVDTAHEELAVIDLPALTTRGAHVVRLRFEGKASVGYQLVSRWFAPRPSDAATAGDLVVAVGWDHTQLAPGETTIATVTAANRGTARADMPIVTVGVPPGFDVEPADLERLVAARTVEKVQRNAREAIFYLDHLDAGKPLTFELHLRPRFASHVEAPPATVYEYYRPEHRGAGAVTRLEVAAR